MKTIASFTVNHDRLEKGMYLSRVDGDVVTYDVRMKKPNGGDYLGNGELHTIEHLFIISATASFTRLSICSLPTRATARCRMMLCMSDRWAAAQGFTCLSETAYPMTALSVW